MIRSVTSFTFILLSFILAGCGPRLQVGVNSIGSIPKDYQSYVLISGMKDISIEDLQFKEYASYISNVLQEKGFKQTDIEHADMGIFVYYGISEPNHTQYSYSLPVYGQTGVSSSNTNATLNSYGNTATYSGTTTYTPTYGVVGSNTYSGINTNYTRHIILDAIDAKKYRATKEWQSLWKTTMISSGSSSDLRLVFPVLMGAGKEYIGANTGKTINVMLTENDDRVLAVKNKQ